MLCPLAMAWGKLVLIVPVVIYTPAALADQRCSEAASFASKLDAVMALSECFLANSIRDNREYIGGVLRTSAGRYVVQVQEGEYGRATIRIQVGVGQKLVALWHTHGGPGFGRHLFSPNDTAVADRLGLPFYLSDPEGVLRVYEPGRHDPRRRVLMYSRSQLLAPRGSSPGRVVARTSHHHHPPEGASPGAAVVASVDQT
jgi:hypothetical protein